MAIDRRAIGARLLQSLVEAGFSSKVAMAEALGFKSQQSIYKLASGQQELDFEALIRFSETTGRSIDYLLRNKDGEKQSPTSEIEPGQVPIYFGPKEQEYIRDIAQAENRSFQEQVRQFVLEELERRGMVNQPEQSNVVFFGEPVRAVTVPLMGWIAAGEPIHVVAEPQDVSVPDFFMKRGKEYFVLHVRGDSMIEDQIIDGSLIVCEARNTAVDGEKVVAMIDGDKATVKRIYHDGDRIRLQPANPLHKPIYVEPDQRLEIQGVVVGIFHKPS